MYNTGEGIFEFFIGVVIAAFILGGLGFVVIDSFFNSDSIESTELIKPRIELTLNEGVIDTLYIYDPK